MPWGGAGGQNVEYPHSFAVLSYFYFCVKCILVLLAAHNSGELHCPATALINT